MNEWFLIVIVAGAIFFLRLDKIQLHFRKNKKEAREDDEKDKLLKK